MIGDLKCPKDCSEFYEYNNNIYNDGDPVQDFIYCPYCGSKLIEEKK